MAKIGVVDCNNFFVSCERLFRPDLQHKPVAVLSSNDGCIVARSQEVKDIGIPMGVPYFKVKDIVKDNNIILFSSHFTLYGDVSRRVFNTLEALVEKSEQYSIDEAFFVVPDGIKADELAFRIKNQIERIVGVPVSVGIGASKTQAKYAVELAKKTNGVKVLDESEWINLASNINLSELWGVGGKSTVHYQAAGYITVDDLLKANSTHIKSLFGVVGERLRAELKGFSAYSVDKTKADSQKSMMSSRSFKESTDKKEVLEDAVAYHTRHIARDLRKDRLEATLVRVTIQPSRYGDFLLQGTTLEAVLDVPTNDTFKLLLVAQSLLNKAYKPNVPYKKAGVIVGQLVSSDRGQAQLFVDNQDVKKSNKLSELMDIINTKADRELITLGDRKKGIAWQARKELVSPAYTTKWTDVAKVKA